PDETCPGCREPDVAWSHYSRTGVGHAHDNTRGTKDLSYGLQVAQTVLEGQRHRTVAHQWPRGLSRCARVGGFGDNQHQVHGADRVGAVRRLEGHVLHAVRTLQAEAIA